MANRCPQGLMKVLQQAVSPRLDVKSELLGHWIDESDHEIHRRHHKRHVPGKTRLFTPLSEWIQHGFSHTRMAYEANMDEKGNGEAEESEGKPSRTSSCLSGRFPKGAWRW